MIENLLPLPIVLPILTALLIVLQSKKSIIWGLALLVSVVCLAIVATLIISLPRLEIQHYPVGNWIIPFGINLGYDSLTAFMLLIVNIIVVVDLLRSGHIWDFDILPERVKYYVTAQMLTLGAYNGMILTNDLFNIYVFTEISSLAVYIMVSLASNRRAPFSAFNYLIAGTIGATFYILGVGFIYAITGTLNMSDMHHYLTTLPQNPSIIIAFSLMFTGWALKIAWFPMHNRLVQIYTSEPMASLPFLSAVSSKVAIYAFIRIVLGMFGVEFFYNISANYILGIIGIISLLWGGICALRSTHMRATLAWSSVSQMGYIAIALSLGNIDGISSALMFIFSHAISKGLAFMAILTLCWQLNRTDVQDHHLGGIAWKSPLAVTALSIAMFSLLGMPGTIGFLAKWSLLKAVINAERWDLLLAIIAGMIIAIGYTWRELHTVLFEIKGESINPVILHHKIRFSISLALILLIIVIIFTGIDFPFISELAYKASVGVVNGFI